MKKTEHMNISAAASKQNILHYARNPAFAWIFTSALICLNKATYIWVSPAWRGAVCSFLLNRLAVTHTSTDTYPIFCILSETNKLLISQFKIHQELNLQPRSTFTWVRKTQRYKTGKTKAMNKAIHSSNTRLKNYHKNTATH